MAEVVGGGDGSGVGGCGEAFVGSLAAAQQEERHQRDAANESPEENALITRDQRGAPGFSGAGFAVVGFTGAADGVAAGAGVGGCGFAAVGVAAGLGSGFDSGAAWLRHEMRASVMALAARC